MAKHFGNLDLTDLASTDDRIYFNLFGLLVHYPAKWAIPITVVFAAIWMAFAVLFARISRLSLKGSLLGLLTPIATIVLSAPLSFGLWSLVDTLWAGKMTRPTGATYDSLLYSVSFILVTFIVHVALTRWIVRKVNELEILLGGSFLFLPPLVGSTGFLPGASYLFAIPSLVHYGPDMGGIYPGPDRILKPSGCRTGNVPDPCSDVHFGLSYCVPYLAARNTPIQRGADRAHSSPNVPCCANARICLEMGTAGRLHRHHRSARHRLDPGRTGTGSAGLRELVSIAGTLPSLQCLRV